jgi:hypothetical protein
MKPTRVRSGWLPVLLFLFSLATFLFGEPTLAQEALSQRNFPASQAQANNALQTIRLSSKGRLPTLEGFVQPTDKPIERYEKGYYECAFQVSPAATGTNIRVTAKITAWYNDSDPTRSGYRVLISNGRLEADVLDRLSEKLTPVAAHNVAPKPGHLLLPPQSPSNNLRYGTNSGAYSPTPKPPADAAAPPSAEPISGLESLKAQREASEKKSQELSNFVKNLEDIQRNQSHPTDLAAVKKSRTPIFAKPLENAQVLMNADAQDEFPVISVDGSWVHVQISGVSRGWIRRAQLELPPGLAHAGEVSTGNAAPSATIFKVAKEDTASFRGDWPPLKGKTVRIEWVEPNSPALPTTRSEKLTFAKSVFIRVYPASISSQPVPEGIVVVFDSADGGQIATTTSNVKALIEHAVSDEAFWRQCSLDPRESFIASAAP